MQRVRISSLLPGQTLTQSLYSPSGQKLLNAGVTLSGRHIQALCRAGDGELLMADGPEDLVAAGILKPVDRSRLTVGQRLKHGVLSNAGQVLIEADEEIEAHHLEALAAAGRGFLADPAAADQRRQRIHMGEALMADLETEMASANLRVPPHNSAAAATPGPPDPPAPWPDLPALIEQRFAQVEILRALFARIEAGVPTKVDQFDPLLSGLLDRLSRHPTRFTQLALLCPRREDYLPDHAYTVAVLAMAVAHQLHWPQEEIRQLGLTGLLFDLGMLLVPERIRTGACQLTDVDRARVRRHPIFTLTMLEVVEDTPVMVRLAALQHQERENGSGYPQGKRRDGICDLARVLAVADSFAAATEPRHYRRPKLPYIAMEETLRSASLLVLWKPAVRALVQAAGLFPVGSYLKLSDGRNAHVIAANAKQVDRPTVQPLHGDGRPKGDAIDLATVPADQVAIVRPLATATG